MIKTKACKECKKKFEYETHSRFERKYCKKCSAQRKKDWDNQWKVKWEDLPDE